MGVHHYRESIFVSSSMSMMAVVRVRSGLRAFVNNIHFCIDYNRLIWTIPRVDMEANILLRRTIITVKAVTFLVYRLE